MANTKVALRRRPHGARRYLQRPFSPVRQTAFNTVAPGGGADSSPVIVTFASTTSGGTLLVVVTGYWNGGNFAPGNVTDDKGNTFTLDFEVTSGASEAAVAFYSCSNFTGGTTHNITLTNGLVVGKCMGVVDYYTTLTKDRTAESLDDATSPHTSGTTATLTLQPSIAMAAIGVDTGDNAALTADADWTLLGEVENGTIDFVTSLVYKTLTSTTAEDAGWTWGGAYISNGAQAGIVTYYEGTAAVTSPWRTGRKHRIVPISSKVARA